MTGGNVRACQPCRNAKTKCDLARPTCARCERLHVRCTGYTAEVDFIFRNENATAARNSRRSRLALRKQSGSSSTRNLGQTRSSTSASSHSGGSPTHYYHSSDDDESWPDFDIEDLHVPASVTTPILDRVVNRYLQDWVIIPTQQGKQTGHLIHVVVLYLSAREKSAFRTTIQACAYAHLQFEEDGAFGKRARTMYGRALALMSREIADDNLLSDDKLLATILMLDNFEILYLNKRDALGPHSEGVKHILTARSTQQKRQLYKGAQSFAIWRIAHHRLLARQIIQRRTPDPAQLRWMQLVEIDRPDLRLSADALEMSVLIGRATALLHAEPDLEPEERLDAAKTLCGEMRELMDVMHMWLDSLPAGWKPRHLNGHMDGEPTAFYTSNKHGPMHQSLIIYHDIWLAYMLEFRDATEIVLRESLIELLQMVEALSDAPDLDNLQDCIQQEIDAIRRISNSIIEMIPKFKHLALTTKGSLQRSFARPELAGRFQSMFAMAVMEAADHVPLEDKAVAMWINDSIKIDYQLH